MNFNCKQFVNFKISRTVSNKTNEFIVHVVIYIVFLPVTEWLDSAVCVQGVCGGFYRYTCQS